ncbi:MAG TPA: LCP family protein [Candidatus Limnocylindrales bacterium]|nr:LCP family protein [Candidatus Limnocylindrales bacterium]
MSQPIRLARPRRFLPGFLTVLLPGLGQLVQGRPRQGWLFLGPSLLFLGIVGALFLADPTGLLLTLVDPTVLLLLLLLQGLVLLWRLAALAATLGEPRLPPLRGGERLGAAFLVLLLVLPQLWLGYATALLRGTAEDVFVGDGRPGATSRPEPIGPSPDWSTGDRVNVLLLGVDKGPGRAHALTDTIIVASVDPTARTVSMLSVPRDMVDVPLPGGGVFRPKINSLITYAERNPDEFPEARGHGVKALAGALSTLLGVPIHYYAEVNLPGFVKLVDAVGGVDVRVTKRLDAPDYRDFGVDGFHIRPGLRHLDGGQALAYARIRKAAGENDFTRAERQQEVLVGLRDAIVGGGFLRDLPGFFAAAAETLETDLPPSRLPFLARLTESIGRQRTYRAVITPPLVRFSSVPDPRGSILIPDVARIRALAAALFPPPGTQPSVGGPSPSASPAAP